MKHLFPETTKVKSIYLAGFDVFREDAVAHGEHLKDLCLEHGFQGLYPLDNAAPEALTGRALAQWICDANLRLIQRADLMMANLNAFRGHEPDSGTVFETGYAVALKKPVWVYTTEAKPLVDQMPVNVHDGGRHVDQWGYTVEDFGLSLNLMVACTTKIVVGDARACLAQISREYGQV
jgi:nucleoside 2-deoxyribosyltransferase